MTPRNVILTKDRTRTFLFLQGPHGPFFQQLADKLRLAGKQVLRVGFNAGDQYFWHGNDNFIAFNQPQDRWPGFIETVMRDHVITDLVLYGDSRPVHSQAIEIAKTYSITIHVFEEGYLRPYWVTYEREGSNGNSALMSIDIDEICARHDAASVPPPEAPATWGDMRQHVFYGALYHWFVLFLNQKYRHFIPHRKQTVAQEFRLYLRKLVLMPMLALHRMVATRRIRRGGFPYHLVLLQLEHDASFQSHSPFSTLNEFLQIVIEGFAQGAASHQHLVFKAHPLEDGRAPILRNIKTLALEYQVQDRVYFLNGGKLAPLLDHARSAITVNSTAGQQVLWRGLPLKALGSAIYVKPEFTSRQSVAEFFRAPHYPDRELYLQYRTFLLETSQVTGGFYSAKGRSQLLRIVVDKMLSNRSPYDITPRNAEATKQQFRVIK